MRPRYSNPGFTLVELLVVVAILTILSIIGTFNISNARVSAQVSRAYADMNAIGLALESYFVDENSYPPNVRTVQSFNGGFLRVASIRLTTPISYLGALPEDSSVGPLQHMIGITDQGHLENYSALPNYPTSQVGNAGRFYYYQNYIDLSGDTGAAQILAEVYGSWVLASLFLDKTRNRNLSSPSIIEYLTHIPYDPTNGVYSPGDLVFSQRSRLW